MKLIAVVIGLMLILTATLPALAAGDSPVASKDGTTFMLEDMNLYFLRSLGNNGLVDFFQMMSVYQEGLKQGLKPTAQETKDFIAKQIGDGTYQQFKQLYSERAVQLLVDYTIVADKYSKWLRDKIRNDKKLSVTEEEARKYFLEHITEFHLPEGVYISIISVDSQDKANAVLKRLGNKENFNDIAAEVNMDPRMRAAKGEYGVYRAGDGLPEPMEKAALALKEGQYSDIIKGENFHILYCHKRYPEVSPSFDEVKEDLMLQMLEAKIDPYYQQEMDKLMEREMPRFKVLAELFRPEEEGSAPPPAANKPAPAKPPQDAGKAGGDAPKVGG